MILKTVKVGVPIYMGTLVMVLVENMTDLDKPYNVRAKDRWVSYCFEIEKKSGAKHYIIALKAGTSNAVIAHEAVHLVNMVFLDSGVELDLRNDETQAYFTAWFVDQIDQFLKEPPKQ